MNKSHSRRRSRCDKKHKHENSAGSSAPANGVESQRNEKTKGQNFTIKISDIMGRYLVAAKDIQEGAIILREEPIAVGPCAGCKVLCLGCYFNLEKDGDFVYYKCNGCGWPLCSENCTGLNTNYGHSAKECAVLKHTKSSSKFDFDHAELIRPHYNAIVPLRCLLLKTTDPEKYKTLMTMEAHNDIRKNIKVIWNTNQIYVVDRIRKDWLLTEFEESEIHTICGILEVNAFEIGQHGISIRGLYPSAFLMAHDCVPNTNHTDDDHHYELTVRASTEIAVNQPITLSYAYTLQSTLKRREHLLESKFFNCVCQRCSDPTEIQTFTGALLCPKCRCGLVLSSNPLDTDAVWTCNNISGECPGYNVTAKSMKLLMERINDEVEAIDGNDVEGFEAFLQKYRNVLHPNHYHCLSVKHSLSQLYGKIHGYMIHELPKHLLHRKRDICKELLKIFDILEPGSSRLRGVTLYELHAPIMILVTREFETNTMSKNELRQYLKEVVSYLQESSRILSYEQDNSVEGMMGNAAKDALSQIKNWEKILGKI